MYTEDGQCKHKYYSKMLQDYMYGVLVLQRRNRPILVQLERSCDIHSTFRQPAHNTVTTEHQSLQCTHFQQGILTNTYCMQF